MVLAFAREPDRPIPTDQLLDAVRRWSPRFDRSSGPANARILEALEQPIPMRFPDGIPLDERAGVHQAGHIDADLPRHPDLHRAARPGRGRTSASSMLVRIDLEGVPLKTTLRLCLKQLGCGYSVQDGYLRIAREEEHLGGAAESFPGRRSLPAGADRGRFRVAGRSTRLRGADPVGRAGVTPGEGLAMRTVRFSIAGLMGAVLVAAVGLAALRIASPIWAGAMLLLTYVVLGLAILCAVLRGRAERAWWLGFCVFGWGYLGCVGSRGRALIRSSCRRRRCSRCSGRGSASPSSTARAWTPPIA